MGRSVKARRFLTITLISAISDRGDHYFSIVKGNNNSQVWQNFLCMLVEKLDEENLGWRASTVILIDESPIHRAENSVLLMEKLLILFLFSAPASYRCIPLEMVFHIVKQRYRK